MKREIIIAITAMALVSCTTTPELPKVVKVPVPVPCEIEKVEPTELPKVRDDMNVFEAAQVRMAQINLIIAENIRLRAANNEPCGDPK
jgi:PBP1b-binding outer membrane lipoprotein LpoB